MSLLRSFADGLVNVLSGAGTSVDKRVHARYGITIVDQHQVEASYRTSWLARKIVDMPAHDMTREWRDWKADTDLIEKIEAEEKRLRLRERVTQAIVLGRLGGGAIYLGIKGDDPSQPLDPERIRPGQLSYIAVFSRWQLTIGQEVSDPEDDLFGCPDYFQITSIANKVGVRIHPSRMVVFKGAHVMRGLGSRWEDAFWGDPIYQAVGDAIRNADSAQNSFASLIDEATYDVIGIPGLMDRLMQPNGDAMLSKRLDAAAAGKSNHRAIVLDSGAGGKDAETWETRQVAWTGMPELMAAFLQTVAGAADIPYTRLVGTSATGMSATGEGDLRDYLSSIASKQETMLRPNMARIDAVMLRSAGIKDELWFDFAPLAEMNEKERAALDKQTADTAKVWADSGLVPIDALAKGAQNLLSENGTYPGLDDELKKADAIVAPDPNAAPVVPDPDDLGLASEVKKPLLKIVGDAAPRSLYVSRPLLNTAEFIAWAKSQGFKTTTPADELHVTITYSKTAVDWMAMGSDSWGSDGKGNMDIAPGGARIVEALGDKGAIVLLFASSSLSWRHEEMVRAGASHDFDEYQPHVTITYDGGDVDLSQVEPYRGALKFGPEVFGEIVEDWRPTGGEA